MPAQLYFRSMIRFASLLLVVLMTSAIALAQNTEVLITVSGPWAYMQDPDRNHPDRIVIMSPDPPMHMPAQIHPEPDADSPSASPSLDFGQYQLNIANPAANCDKTDVQGAEQKASLFPLEQHFPKPTPDQIRKVIQTAGSRFAISLPKPCYYSSWHTSYSIVSENTITTSEQTAEGLAYTTEMVLHYFVTAIAPATLTRTPDVGSQSTSTVQFLMNKIEIEMRSSNPPQNSSPCDAMSAESFREEVEPFLPAQTVVHVWFPDLDDGGFQTGNKGHYHNDCQDPRVMAPNTARMLTQTAAKALAGIKALQAYAKHKVPGREEAMEKKLMTIKTLIRTLQASGPKGGLPTKPAFLKANQELEAASKALASKNRLKREDFDLPLVRNLIDSASPGSADCQGGQGSVDGTGG